MTFLGRLRNLRPRRLGQPVSRQAQPDLEVLEDRCVPSTTGFSSIQSNFNGTAIPAGDSLWFSSVMKVNGLGSAPVILHVTGQKIDFSANGTNYDVSVPDDTITLDPTATTAATSFNATSNSWVTTLPTKFSGNAFVAGVVFMPPNGLPGGINPVTWSGHFSSDTSGVSVNWQWATAVYTNSSTDYNALNVKPVDDNHLGPYYNSDHAGTPEAFKNFVTGGARGGGGSNWTGSLSATATVVSTLAQSTLSGVVTDQYGNLLGGVGLTLSWTDSTGQGHTLTTTTDTNGAYSFTGLTPGTYTISETSLTAVSDSVGTVNGVSNGTAPSAGTLTGINLTNGNNGSNYNFVGVFAGS